MSTIIDLSEHTWERMVAQPEKYLPIIERLVGYFLLHDHRTNQDHDPSGEIARATVAGLVDLSEREHEFVIAGAVQIYYGDDPGHVIRSMARAWLEDGAPS